MKKITYVFLLLSMGIAGLLFITSEGDQDRTAVIEPIKVEKKSKKSMEERVLFAIERVQYEYDLQKDPITGLIPEDQRDLELQIALEERTNPSSRISSNVYVPRGPSNLGGRTREVVIDISDPTGNTMIAGAVSGGVYRTTNGGASWTRVTANNDIHNATAIVQDPRPGFQNIWYYGTGELFGNSASFGAFFPGNGIWQSVDGGQTWNQIPGTESPFTQAFDSPFDIITGLAVSPVTGDLLIGALRSIYRYDGTDLILEIDGATNSFGYTDVAFTADGRAYAAIDGFNSNATNGVHTSATGNGSWTRIAQEGVPAGWDSGSTGRIVLSTVPSNNDLLYALYANGDGGNIEADLWRYELSTDTWTDFSSTLPDEPGNDLGGNDPFAVQFGYDLVISVKPDDENFVAIGGTNAYVISDIETEPQFRRIGGYRNQFSFALYDLGGGDTHHPDIHSLVFSPFDSNVLFSATDGGVHRTDDVTAVPVAWVNLNNEYQTYQYYDVALDQGVGSDFVAGGAQDNGTTIGGTTAGFPNNSEMSLFFGGDGVSVGIARRGPDFQLYFGSQNGNVATNFPSFRSIRPNGTNNSLFVTLFHLDEDNQDLLYYADGDRLFRTTDAENVVPATWDNLGSIGAAFDIRSFATTRGAYNAATSYLAMGTSNGRVLRLDDPQNAVDISSAVDITPSGASTTNGTVVSAFAMHPDDPDIAMVVYSNYNIPSIFVTNDATSANPTWTLAEQNLAPFSIRSAAILEVDGQVNYYVGTARGLYSNLDPTIGDWALEGIDEMGLALVSDLEYRPSDDKLLVGTHGNGMYDTDATVLSVEDIDGDLSNNLTLFPNPATTELNFRLVANGVTLTSYQTYDLTGRVVSQGNLDDVTRGSLDVSGYNTGMYFFRAVTQDNRVITSRFIKR